MTLRPIRLLRVRQNNLRNVSVTFPARQLSVVTGLSGSGKSSLVFDTLYAEGQRRYVESLSTYTRQFLEKMPKPDLDGIENIPPAIALEQKNHIVNSRSTVGTQTELVDYLRILFSKIGQTLCTDCGGEVKSLNAQSLLDWALDWLPNKKAFIVAPIWKAAETSQKKRGSQPKKKLATLQSFIQILREQGFQRILVRYETQPHRNPQSLALTQIENPKFQLYSLEENPQILQENTEVFVVVDRIKFSGIPDSDIRSRLLDSIDQALSIGQGRIGFYDGSPESSLKWKLLDSRFSCTQCSKVHRTPEPSLFSFNSPLGACTKCSGFGFTLDLDENLIIPDPTKPLMKGAIDPFSKPFLADWQKNLFRFAERQGISIGKRYGELTGTQKQLLWQGDPNDLTFPGIIACFEQLKRWKYKLHIRVFMRRYQSQTLCTECGGSRLKPEALAVKIDQQSIVDILGMPVSQASQWIQSIRLPSQFRKIADEVFQQVKRRLFLLEEVGVGYLTLSRLAKTLSGGEFQRINLATQLGNGLCGTLYVLDEPSIGLHAADTAKLITILERLRDQGNTVVIVEHDLDVIKSADWLIELGPGAGHRGGKLIAQGTPQDLIQNPKSLTGEYLSGQSFLVRDRPLRPPSQRVLKLTGCKENNLKNLTVHFPLNRFIVVTGVSGSGKSTLVHTTLHQALFRLFGHSTEPTGRFDHLYGAEQLNGVVLLDQTPIGKTSRSNPVTYIKAWGEIRRIYSSLPLSLRRGYTPQYFSFNVDGGRCSVCQGEGKVTIDMHFMAEIQLPCEECSGKRFKKDLLDIVYRGKNLDQLLHSTIDEAFELFEDHANLSRKLRILREVGLGYLQVGQPSTTLSGGESQRLKIAATLENKTSENLLYIFDEPTTGLHLEDIKKFMRVVQDLVDAHHSVIMIEHHLDVISQADWVIDLGPGGGTQGGELIAQGCPAQILEEEKSITGQILKKQGYQLRILGRKYSL